MTPVLLPLYVTPSADPGAWRSALRVGEGATVVVDAAGGGDGPLLAEALSQLAKAGVAVLGRVDTGFATRPVADLLDDVAGWAGRAVAGVFLDQAPTSPFALGPVALAARAARRAGLSAVLLNPGIPADPLYRDLGLPICSFEGPWREYHRWSGEGSQPGDGHLVHSVPPPAVAAAWQLLHQRRAGFGLVTDRTPPEPYRGVPGWLAAGDDPPS